MRISYLVLCLLLAACGSKPEKATFSTKLSTPLALSMGHQDQGVWFISSNQLTGGALARLDLTTGELNPNVLATRTDTSLFSDFGASADIRHPQGLFLTVRGGNDTIAIASGKSGKIVAQTPLISGMNPQFASRDAEGKVWVTGANSNFAHVFTPDLKKKVGAVNLAVLAEGLKPTPFALLSQSAQLGLDHMLVTAQRQRRRPKAWRPEPQAGLAVINIHSLKIESHSLLDSPNPVRILSDGKYLYSVGAGDLSPLPGLKGKLSLFEFQGLTPMAVEEESLDYAVLDAHVTSIHEPPALIAWYRHENQTCLQVSDQKLYCEEGHFIFNRILRVENTIFASYSSNGKAELWILSFDLNRSSPVHSIEKLSVRLPIQSMAMGP